MTRKILMAMVALALIASAEARGIDSNWMVSYVCYEKGEPDSIGCAIVVANSGKAARAQFLRENVGEVCKVTAVERAPREKARNDYARFQSWMERVHKIAPRYGLRLEGNEAEAEFFWLYCWQSADHSVVHAIRKAKESWGVK